MKYLCIALIRFYRRFLSPLKRNPTCRFTPTCSAYALEAFQKRGFFAGLILTVWRVLRCNPFCAGGYDPVPEHGFRRERPVSVGSLAAADDTDETDDEDVPLCNDEPPVSAGNGSSAAPDGNEKK